MQLIDRTASGWVPAARAGTPAERGAHDAPPLPRRGRRPPRGWRLGLSDRARRGDGPWRRIWLAGARFRRPLILLLVLAAVWGTVRLAAPPPGRTQAVTVAVHDLSAGHRLTPDDVTVAHWPADAAPAGQLAGAQVIGHTLATAITAGDVITAPRLLGPGLLTGQPTGTVAVTVRVADPASLGTISAGDRIDVLAGPGSSWDLPTPADDVRQPSDPAQTDPARAGRTRAGAGAERLAAGVVVLAKPSAGDSPASDGGWPAMTLGPADGTSDSAGTGGVLVLAVDAATAGRLAVAAGSRPLSVVLLSR